MTRRRTDLLTGWKQIAEYLGCSVATAARRERDGLPVFRSGGQVRAFVGDIDRWLKSLRAKEAGLPGELEDAAETTSDLAAILTTLLRGETQEKLAVVRLGKDVAEFERIEVQLKSAEEKYRELVETIPEWVWETNAAGDYVYSSPRVAEITGYEPEEVLGLKADDFLVHEGDADDWRRAIEGLKVQKEVIRDLYSRFVRRDGSVRYVETSANPVFDASGELVGIRGISRDVTDRLRLQEEIAKTRQYLHNVLASSMDAIVTTDMNGRVLIWNRGAEAIYGYSEAEAVGKDIDGLTDPPGWDRRFARLLAILEDRGGWYAEEPIERRRKDGTTFYASGSYSVVYGADGEPVGVCGITRDITDRLNAEKFTREALARFESVLDNVPNVAVQGFKRDGTIVHWNRAAEFIFGSEAPKAAGKSRRRTGGAAGRGRRASSENGTTGPENATAGLLAELERIYSTGEPGERRESSIVAADGTTRWIYSQMFPVFVDESVDEVFRISVDITDRKKAETALETSEALYRYLYEETPTVNVIIGAGGEVKDVNDSFLGMLGYERDEVIGRQAVEFVAPEERQATAELLEKKFRGELTPSVDIGIIAKDGSVRTVLFSPGAVRMTENDSLVGILVSGVDITERKEAARALEDSERTYRSLYGTTLALAEETDLETVIKVIADHATELLRAKDAAVYLVDYKRRVLVPIYSNDPEEAEAIMAFDIPVGVGLSGRVAETGVGAYINAGDEDDYSVHIPGTDEADEQFESVISVPMLDGESVLGVLSVGKIHGSFGKTDLEKLGVFARQAEIAIKRARYIKAMTESEEKYRNLVETVKEGMVVVDASENLTFVNRAFAGLLGYTVEELIGMNLKDLTTPGGFKKILEETEKRKKGVSSKYVVGFKRKDRATADFLISAVPIQGEGGVYVGAAGTVTELPELETYPPGRNSSKP